MAARMQLKYTSNLIKLSLLDRSRGHLDASSSTITAVRRQFCSDSGEKKEKSNLKLAKPGSAKARQNLNTAELSSKNIAKAQKSPAEEGIASELISAIDSVAKSGQNAETIRSDLLQKLQEHNNVSFTSQAKESSTVSSLIAGMTIDKRGDKPTGGYDNKSRRSGDTERLTRRSERSNIRAGEGGEESERRPRHDGWDTRRSGEHDVERMKRSEQYQQFQRQKWTEGSGDRKFPRRDVADIKLFDGPALGIFTKSYTNHAESDSSSAVASTKSPSIFDELEQEEMHKMMSMPPSNAFEEMIRWTREGKLWHFPIDNDQGMEEEAKYGFHDHIFLEHLLGEFPKKGPIRHFMELVVVGLSHNPYFTVKEKHNHIAWFSNYFKDKYKLIEELSSSSSASPEMSEQLNA